MKPSISIGKTWRRSPKKYVMEVADNMAMLHKVQAQPGAPTTTIPLANEPTNRPIATQADTTK
jgi:hypothetical protein